MTFSYGPDTEARYATAGFGARANWGDHPAVVVVDLTLGFTDPSYPSGADLDAVVESTGRLVDCARRIDIPVVFTTISYTPDELEAGRVVWLDKAPGMRIMEAGTRAVAIDERLPRQADDLVVVKKGASAFFGTELARRLSELGVDTVVVCGATTSGCVRASAVDAVQSGFSVIVPRECVGDRSRGPHEANLFDIDAKYGDVVNVDDVIDYFTGLDYA